MPLRDLLSLRSTRGCLCLLLMAVGCSQLPLSIDEPPDLLDAGSSGGGAGGAFVMPMGGDGGFGAAGQGGAAMGGTSATGGMATGTGGMATGTGGMAPGTGGMAPGTGGMAPPPECTSGLRRCVSSIVELCVNGRWEDEKDCGLALGCSAGACKACMPNAVACQQSKRSVCSANGQSKTETACAFGCILGGIDCRECATDGLVECPTNSSVRACQAGRWTSPTACAATEMCSTPSGCSCPPSKSKFNGRCTEQLGYFVPFNYLGQVSGGFSVYERINLPRPAVLSGFGFILTPNAPGIRVRMALYRDVAGGPSTLVAESATASIGGDRNEIASTSTPALTVGDYWVVVLPESSTNVRQDSDNPVPYRTQAQSFSKAFPATVNVPPPMPPTHSPFNIYLLVE